MMILDASKIMSPLIQVNLSVWPSVHAAFVFPLGSAVSAVYVFLSTSFAIAASMVIFVLDDALRMRIFLGQHGAALHRLVSLVRVEEREKFPPLVAHLGHKPTEVTVGAVLGVVLTLLVLSFLSP